jgi:hypothetical protein
VRGIRKMAALDEPVGTADEENHPDDERRNRGAFTD